MSKYKIIRKVGYKFKRGEEVELTDGQALYYNHLGYIKLPKDVYQKFYEANIRKRDVQTAEDRKYMNSVKKVQKDQVNQQSLEKQILAKVSQDFVTKEVLDKALDNVVSRILGANQPEPPELDPKK